jgi:hypothetical protein
VRRREAEVRARPGFMGSHVIATHIEIILIITGAVTATMLSQFFAPLPVLRLVYGETHLDAVSMALARHWGLLIFCVGALLVYAAYVPPLRAPIMVVAVIEKVGLGVCVLGTSCAGGAWPPCSPVAICSWRSSMSFTWPGFRSNRVPPRRFCAAFEP